MWMWGTLWATRAVVDFMYEIPTCAAVVLVGWVLMGAGWYFVRSFEAGMYLWDGNPKKPFG